MTSGCGESQPELPPPRLLGGFESPFSVRCVDVTDEHVASPTAVATRRGAHASVDDYIVRRRLAVEPSRVRLGTVGADKHGREQHSDWRSRRTRALAGARQRMELVRTLSPWVGSRPRRGPRATARVRRAPSPPRDLILVNNRTEASSSPPSPAVAVSPSSASDSPRGAVTSTPRGTAASGPSSGSTSRAGLAGRSTTPATGASARAARSGGRCGSSGATRATWRRSGIRRS